MSPGFFVLVILTIAVFSGGVYFFRWVEQNVEFSPNPTYQRRWKMAIRILRVIWTCILAYIVFDSAVILLAPFFDLLSNAFDAAVTKIFAFLEKLIPWVVLGGIGLEWWKQKHPQQTIRKGNKPTDGEIEFARQRGVELQKVVLAFLYRIIIATHQYTQIIPPNDEKGIAVMTSSGYSFYMDDAIVIYQGIVAIDGEVTTAVEDDIRNELQEAVPKYIDEFSELVDETRNGYPPVEILTVRGVGKKVIIDAVIASEQSIPLIKARRLARIERQNRQVREVDARDPLFR